MCQKIHVFLCKCSLISVNELQTFSMAADVTQNQMNRTVCRLQPNLTTGISNCDNLRMNQSHGVEFTVTVSYVYYM